MPTGSVFKVQGSTFRSCDESRGLRCLGAATEELSGCSSRLPVRNKPVAYDVSAASREADAAGGGVKSLDNMICLRKKSFSDPYAWDAGCRVPDSCCRGVELR